VAAIAREHYGWEIPWNRISDENKKDFRNHASVIAFKKFYVPRSIVRPGQTENVEVLRDRLQIVGEKLVGLREHLSV
jgi:hypothetical protein